MFRFLKNINQLKPRMVIFNLVVVGIVALLLEACIISAYNRSSCKKNMSLLADQVTSVLLTNDLNEADLVNSMKTEYKVRAKAVAYYLENNPEAEEDIEELEKLAELLDIDEIHIFDSTGTIVNGTVPEYYGLSFDSGDQMAYFKPMLEDKKLSMCQDVTPNTAENKEIMYAITWNESGTEMIQVGIEPDRLLERLASNEVATVVNNMPEYQGYNIYVLDPDSLEIEGSTDSNAMGQTLDYLGLNIRETDLTGEAFNISGSGLARAYYKCRLTDEYAVVITHLAFYDFQRYFLVELIAMVYLLLAAIIIYKTIARLLVSNGEKENQLAIMKSMADIYYSMHKINLVEDSLVEYKAQFEVKEIADHEEGAEEMMVDTICRVVSPEHMKAALEFTDLKTIAERMKDRKVVSSEFIGNRIGWFEASFVALKQDSEGRPTEVMFTTRSIDAEKKKEEVLIKNSNTDELTGLLNRRVFEQQMGSGEIPFENLVYIAFDINELKHVNDSLGHAAGDELIIATANCIRDAFGEYGMVFRTGGDEFIAILHLSREDLNAAQEKFEKAMNEWAGEYSKELRISCGYVSAEDQDFTTIKEVATLADKRMYQSKSEYYKGEGKDRRRRNS